MRKLAVIGAGQGGLHLAIGLLDKGYDVTLFTDRTADQMRESKIQAAPILFGSVVKMEKDLGLNFWDDKAPWGEGINIDFRSADGNTYMTLRGELGDKKGQAVDFRYKFARWLEEYENRSGSVVYGSIDVDGLEKVVAEHDLSMIAIGKGEMTHYFERDDERSVYDSPPRMLAALLVKGERLIGKQPFERIPFTPLWFNIIDNIGGLFSLPYYSEQVGECRSLMFEAVPGRAMDIFKRSDSPEAMLSKAKQIIHDFIPNDFPNLEDAELIDDKAIMAGSYVPVVRKPVGVLPSGNKVMLVGDTVVLNDPYAGQGANNASRMANTVINRIVEHADNAFDEEWITDVFEEFWNTNGRYATEFTNALMDGPTPGMLEVIAAAVEDENIANIFMQNFDDPARFWPWFDDVEEAKRFIDREKEKAGTGN